MLADELEHGIGLGGGQQLFGSAVRHRDFQPFQDRLRHHQMAEIVGMDLVAGEMVVRIGLLPFRQCGGHGGMEIGDGDHALGRSLHFPFGEFGQHLVVGPVGGLLGIEYWRSHQDHLGAGGLAVGGELGDAILERLHPLVVQRQIDAIVHPVAGDHHLRLHRLQRPLQPFVDAGPRKGAAGMPFFGKPRRGFAGEPDIDDVERLGRMRFLQEVFDEGDIHPVLGDAVAEYHHPFARQQVDLGRRLRRRCRCRSLRRRRLEYQAGAQRRQGQDLGREFRHVWSPWFDLNGTETCLKDKT